MPHSAKMFHLPRAVSEGFSATGLPFRAGEEGGPGKPASTAYVFIRVMISQAEWGVGAKRQSSALWLAQGNLRKSQLTGGFLICKRSPRLQGLQGMKP